MLSFLLWLISGPTFKSMHCNGWKNCSWLNKLNCDSSSTRAFNLKTLQENRIFHFLFILTISLHSLYSNFTLLWNFLMYYCCCYCVLPYDAFGRITCLPYIRDYCYCLLISLYFPFYFMFAYCISYTWVFLYTIHLLFEFPRVKTLYLFLFFFFILQKTGNCEVIVCVVVVYNLCL